MQTFMCLSLLHESLLVNTSSSKRIDSEYFTIVYTLTLIAAAHLDRQLHTAI
jgi:hypothetical protein